MPSSPSVEVKQHTFAEAVDLIVSGKKVRRPSWPDGCCIFLHAGVLHVRKEDSSLHTLIVSDVDIVATDYVELFEH